MVAVVDVAVLVAVKDVGLFAVVLKGLVVVEGAGFAVNGFGAAVVFDTAGFAGGVD